MEICGTNGRFGGMCILECDRVDHVCMYMLGLDHVTYLSFFGIRYDKMLQLRLM